MASWSPITNGVPGAPQVVSGTTILNGVACTDATTCVAVGSNRVGTVNRAVVVSIVDGVAGAVQTHSVAQGLNSVACSSATSCVAVGGQSFQGVVVPITNGTPGPAQLIATVRRGLTGVACYSPTVCLAVGTHAVGTTLSSALVSITNGSAGTAQPVPGTRGLTAIACRVSICEATGNIAPIGLKGVVQIIDGVPGGGQVAPGSINTLAGIACPSDTLCEAVGSAPGGASDTGVLVPVSSGIPANGLPVPGTNALNGIACTTTIATTCIAVGSRTLSGGTVGVVVTITIPVGTTLTYSGPTTGDFNDAATVSATLKDTNGNPVSGATVTFTLNGSETCTDTTDADGDASCSITPAEPAGTYTLTADYAGDATYLPSSTSTPFTVTLEESSLTSTTALQLFAQGGGATLSSTLTDPDGGAPIPAKPVTMTLGSGIGAQSCTATTGATGTATCVINPVTVALGPQPVTDTFAGDGFYEPASNAQSALVFAFSQGGSFVVGDRSASGPVTFWGAKWSKLNSLSGGGAPSAFKGFENDPVTPSCGTAWTTNPGSSAGPPATIPSYMAVVVSSSIRQSGSTISGNAVGIVIVKTDPGYAPDPSHPGTGTVVATLC